ncbi:DUF222 domain-containing protein [Actinotalea ferrariae]|uniref:HNH endonuclease signature motif containing protein n=1 Tax=Actinotalea ferrariae TaxID=1386098 RepID=UPI001C8B6F56|nr:HNH endonuclease signature motif containing protein [Actinotalea ferrariae]MBX9243510.1 DUF222 domain-containing protein [Actinotalea ferrariae]
MSEAVARLDELVARLSADAVELAALTLDELDPGRAAAAHRSLRQADDRLRLVASTLLAKVEAAGVWEASGGARTLPQWAVQRDGVSYGTARREVTLGRAMESTLPATRAAVAAGEITLEHAQVLAEVAPTSDARRSALTGPHEDRNEGFLLAAARRLGVDDFRKVARRWAVAVDDDAAQREHRDAAGREYLTVARRRDGFALTGFLTHESGTLLTTALRAVAGVPAKDDERSAEQRSAAALTSTARLVLDKGVAGVGAQVRPHLSVHVSFETLERLAAEADERDRAAGGDGQGRADAETREGAALLAPAELESGEPLPRRLLQRIACDSEVTRIVFDAEGQVLDVGRAHRTYAKQLRRAVIARDRHCQYPGCSTPPELGEVHHIVWWSRRGPTSAKNGVLLCWYHHDLVHDRDLRVVRRAHGFDVLRADGSPLRDPVRTASGDPPRGMRSASSPTAAGSAGPTRADPSTGVLLEEAG